MVLLYICRNKITEMKKIILLFVMFLIASSTFAQKKLSIKGSKIVSIQKKEVAFFDAIEVQDGLEITLVKGEKSGVELEADDNLQDAIGLSINGNTLVISSLKNVYGFKKFNIRVTYTNNFKSVTAKNKSVVNVMEEMVLDEITFKSFDDAKFYLNLNVKSFQLIANDASRIEMNLKADNTDIQLNNGSELKALIASNAIKCDLYQKSKANIEGDCIVIKLRLDNNSKFIGNKLTAKSMKLIAEAYTNSIVFAETNLELEASGNAEIDLYGSPQIDVKKFADSAIISKKM